jgi:hypothetical protein
MNRTVPDFDVSVVLRVRDDEERIGHVLGRIIRHLRSLGVRFEVLVADEGSGDNTVAVATLHRPTAREIEILHCEPGQGLRAGCVRARGRAIVVYDVSSDAPLAAVGFALERLRVGADVVAVSGRYLVFRRTRAWRAFDALTGQRSAAELERRFLKRARSLGLVSEAPHPSRRSLASLGGRLFATLVAARS